HAARQDALLRSGDVVAHRPVSAIDKRRGGAVVHLAVPHEVAQAIDVGDGVAVEHHADVVRDALPVWTLAGAVLVTAAAHVVGGWDRRVRSGLEGDVAGATHADAFLDQPERTLRLLRGDEIERAALIVWAPPAPVRERRH